MSEFIAGMQETVAYYLLQSKAIKIELSKPFTWASGWKSPIYCDNRKTLSYPEIRSLIRNRFVEMIGQKFPEASLIAGVATGAIAQGVLVAEALSLPFVYVRSAPKHHGLENLIEGVLHPGARVVVVEDLVSTGGSSLSAVEAIRRAGGEVLGMVAIFTYGFPLAQTNFQKAGCPLFTLTDYNELIDKALEMNYVQPDQIGTLKEWRKAPERWMQESPL